MALPIVLVLELANAPVANAQQSIQFAEPVNLSLKSSVAEFEAYGRHFSLALTGNERVLQKLSDRERGTLASYRLLRGSVAGAPGSWVRLTETPQGPEGAIWDGHEFYAVTRYENIAEFLTTPLDAAPGQTVVYRLSDSRDALPRDFCGMTNDVAEAQAPTSLEQYRALVTEIGGVITPSITRQIEISLIADSAFQQHESSDPMAAMLARLNIVEGIFSEQVGLLILATDIRMMAPDSDPFTSTKGTTLLEQLGSYRSATPAVRARGLAHLMTGKDLDGTTAGIAYVRTVCDRERGVSISQRSYGTTISALVMAHELGHNFGAEHDGEPGTICAKTERGFIMAASVSGYSTFSQCSIDTMQPVLASASCVQEAQFADVTVLPDVESVRGEAGLPFTLPFTVRSIGNVDAQGAAISITLPANSAYLIESVSSSIGSCSVSGLTANCALGDLDQETVARVSVVGRASSAVAFTAQARVTASNDRLTSNNNRQIPVTLRSGIDARLTLQTSDTQVPAGATLSVFADVSSRRAMPVRNATLSVNLNQPVLAATIPGGTCNVSANSVVCQIAEIAPGSTQRLTVSARAQTPGSLFAGASVGAPGDGDLTNNNASTTAWVQAERDVELGAPHSLPELAVGAVHEIPFTVISRGSQPTGEVQLLITLPPALQVDSLDTGGPECAHPSEYVWRCELGVVPPGATRVVRLRAHASVPMSGDVSAVAITSDDGYPGNNSVNLPLRIEHVVDLSVEMASGGSGLEDTRIEGQVALRSNGRQAAIGGTLDIDLHAAGVLTAANIHHGAACQLLSPTRARCVLPNLARNANLYVDYSAEFAEPGNFAVTFTAAVAGDSSPGNDTLTRAVLVRPYLDAGISGSLNLDGLFGGQTRTTVLSLTTDRRGLATARFQAPHAAPGLRVDAISAAGAACRVDDELGGLCEFTDLPAHASVPVSVTWRADAGSWLVEPAVGVATPGDVASANNTLSERVETVGSTDVELRVADSLGGARATPLSFPVIELVNGDSKAITPRLEVILPPEITVVEVSANDAMCSGTTTLRCDFNTLAPQARASVTLSVRASANGNFASQVRVVTINDNNPANDSREVQLQISGGNTAAVDAPASGGGGRIEWLALLLLALIKWGHSPRILVKKAGKRSRASLA